MHRWLPVLALVGGCSFALSGPDPARPRNEVPRCDTTKGLVVLDGLMATAMGVVALSIVGTDEPAIALIPAAIGALYVGGAIHGNSSVNACRAEMDGFAMGRVPVPDDTEPRTVTATATRFAAPGAQLLESPEPAVAARPGPPAPPLVPAPAPTAPSPAAQPPAPQTPPAPVSMHPRAPTKAAPPAATDDEWGEFWKEVP